MLLNGERVGRFADRADAVGCAIEAASSADYDGVPVEVLVHGRFGEVTTLPLHSRTDDARA